MAPRSSSRNPSEVTLNDQLNYGAQYYLDNHVNFASGGLTSSGRPLASGSAQSGFNVIIGHAATPHVVISALHQLTDVKILSNPWLVIVDNQQATLEVGDQVPVSTGSATVLSANNAVVNTIDYKTPASSPTSCRASARTTPSSSTSRRRSATSWTRTAALDPTDQGFR